MISRIRSFTAAFLYFAIAVPAGAVPSITAKSIPEAIVLDGILNDPVWKSVPAASGFTQREPKAGTAATEETEILIAYTVSTLYIGIRALDSEPRAMVARAMQRDADITEDDSVSIALDTFDDRKNGYFFATNANGVRVDALMSDEGDEFNVEWNGVWNVKARRSEEGWTAEMEIPFSTLRFSPDKEAWGMNVRPARAQERRGVVLGRPAARSGHHPHVPRRPADRARRDVAGLESPCQAVCRGLGPRRPLRAGQSQEPGGRRPDGQQYPDRQQQRRGYKVGRGLSLDLTVNTDFAESQVDEQQVNLSRFSLFLPERREFFLENAGIFEFGPRSLWTSPVMRPFFSRRVGLTENGEAVPIEWGTRLTGRTGPWSIGLLDAQTGAPDGGDGDNWGVLRVKRRVGEEWSVGLLSTRHAADGHENRVYGLDADWNPTSRLKVRSFLAQSDDTSEGTGRTGGLGAVYRGPVWRWSLDAAEIGERTERDRQAILKFTWLFAA